MPALKGMAGVVTAGVLALFGGIGFAIAFVLLWACGVASGLCLMVALFAQRLRQPQLFDEPYD